MIITLILNIFLYYPLQNFSILSSSLDLIKNFKILFSGFLISVSSIFPKRLGRRCHLKFISISSSGGFLVQQTGTFWLSFTMDHLRIVNIQCHQNLPSGWGADVVKKFFYFKFMRLSCSAHWNHLSNFYRVPLKDHFCIVSLNVLRAWGDVFIGFIMLALANLVQRIRTIWAIFVKTT
jgi:hypothetical protein